MNLNKTVTAAAIGLAAVALFTTVRALSQTAPMPAMAGMRKSAGATKSAQAMKKGAPVQGMKDLYTRLAPMAGMSKSVPMAILAEKRVSMVTGSEDWNALRGFGDDAGMASMMTLMMVGGSGMEHMKMAPMKYAQPVKAPDMPGPTAAQTPEVAMPVPVPTTSPNSPVTIVQAPPAPAVVNNGVAAVSILKSLDTPAVPTPTVALPTSTTDKGLTLTATVTPNPPRVGPNTLQITVTNSAAMPVTGLKIASAVSMTSMDMGTTHPSAKETKPGVYVLPFQLSMQGPWQVVVMTPPTGTDKGGKLLATLHFEAGGKDRWAMATAGLQISCNVKPTAGKVGANTLDFTVKSAAGAPVLGATVTADVLMTSMDMGVTHPVAKEMAKGTYRTAATFSMVGPWRVKLKVAQKGMPTVVKLFDFTAK